MHCTFILVNIIHTFTLVYMHNVKQINLKALTCVKIRTYTNSHLLLSTASSTALTETELSAHLIYSNTIFHVGTTDSIGLCSAECSP